MTNEKESYAQSQARMSNMLKIQQQSARKEEEKQTSDISSEEFDRDIDDESVSPEEIDAKVSKKKKKSKTKAGTKDQRRVNAKKLLLIRKVKRKIKKETFGGTLFFTTLIVALIKDSLDLSILAVFGPAIAFVINPLLSILIWIAGSSKAERKLQKIIIVNLIEMIPLLSIFPSWVMMVIKIKMDQDKKVHRLVRILKRLEKKTK